MHPTHASSWATTPTQPDDTEPTSQAAPDGAPDGAPMEGDAFDEILLLEPYPWER